LLRSSTESTRSVPLLIYQTTFDDLAMRKIHSFPLLTIKGSSKMGLLLTYFTERSRPTILGHGSVERSMVMIWVMFVGIKLGGLNLFF